MSYPEVYGAVLPLEANVERGRGSLKPLIQILRAMGEDPDVKTIERERPPLLPLVATHGNPYTKEELTVFDALVGDSLALPCFDRGLEALLRTEECDLLELPRGWTVMRGQLREGARHPFASDPPPFIVEQSNLSDLIVMDGIDYASIHEALLDLGGGSPPRLRLLWENSD